MNFDSSRHSEIASLIAGCIGFEWDAGNSGKNWESHKVTDRESEEVFQSGPLVFYDDLMHSAEEERFTVLGRNSGNALCAPLCLPFED
jgi:uncharacterized DUF497 family protein